MKILYVTNMYPSAGRIHDGVFIKEQIEYSASKFGIQAQVYCILGMQSKWNYLKSIFEINALLAREKFDLIHVHFGLSGIFLLFNPFIRTPVVVTLHGSDIQAYSRVGMMQRLSKLVVKRATQVIILNKKMADILQRDRAKLVTIPCGINIADFDRKRNNLNNEKFVIGFPATRHRPVKNYALFRAIVEKLEARGYPVNTVELDGFNREELADHLSRLDCLVMTSFSEGSPQIIKEAMVCGVPVLSTNVGDVKILLDGVNHCSVIDSFHPDAFVEKVLELIRLEATCRTTNGKDRIKVLQLDQDTICNRIYQLYERVLGYDNVTHNSKQE